MSIALEDKVRKLREGVEASRADQHGSMRFDTMTLFEFADRVVDALELIVEEMKHR